MLEWLSDLFCSLTPRKSNQDGSKKCDFGPSEHLLKRSADDSISHFFSKYCSNEDDPQPSISPDDIERFCSDLKIPPDDLKMLVFAWKCQAANMGYFTKKEFTEGMKAVGASSLEGLASRLEDLEKHLHNDETDFKLLYRFAFQFYKETKEQKVIQKDVIIQMINLLLGKRRLIPDFVEFLEKSHFGALNSDQWNLLLEFVKYHDQELSNYDDSAAWPTIFDEFVLWRRQRP